SSKASSPVVSANINTSVEVRRAAETSARFSVAVTTMSLLRDAIAATAARAAGMESCRKPAVAVSISTRTGGTAGGAVVVVEDGVDCAGEPGCEQLRVSRTSNHTPPLTAAVYFGPAKAGRHVLLWERKPRLPTNR